MTGSEQGGTEDPLRSEVTKGNRRSITKNSFSGLFWLSSSTAIQGILSIIVLAILGRLLTPEEFGLVGAALVVIWFSSIFSELGVGQALVQRPAIQERHIDTGFTSSLLLGGAFALLIWFLAPAIANFFRMEGLVPIVRSLSIIFPITSVGVVAGCLLQRELNFAPIARIDVIAYASGYAFVGVLLAFLGFGVWALVGANISKSLIKSGLLLRAGTHSLRLRFHPEEFLQLLRFGGGYTAGRLSTYFALQGDALVVGRWLGAAALGFYGRAYTLMTMPATALSTVLGKVLFPAMAQLQDDRPRLKAAYRRGVAVGALAVLPLSVFAIVLAPELVRAYLGSGWEGVILPFQILAVGMYFRVGYLVGGALARATGAVYRLAWRNGVYAGLVVGGAWVGQHWGLSGVAWGVLFALAANFLLVAQLSGRLTGLTWREFLGAHLPAVVLSGTLGIVAWSAVFVLRSSATGPFLTLAVTGILAVLTTLGAIVLRPDRVLGKDGRWMVLTTLENLPKSLAASKVGSQTRAFLIRTDD